MEARQQLSLRRPIEQFLGATSIDGETRLRWVRIHFDQRLGYCVTAAEVLDEGASLPDIYEFASIDPDEPDGRTTHHESVEQALEQASTIAGVRADRFVVDGALQKEYEACVRNDSGR